MLNQSRAFVVCGMAFGDEGKGTIVEALARWYGARLVVRYCGGAQAAHNVVLADGRHHTFAQWGSATLHGVPTLLSRNVVVNPVTMMPEAWHLMRLGIERPYDLLHVEREAIVTTPYHVLANRLKSLAAGSSGHGTTGMGIGETVADARDGLSLHVGELADGDFMRRTLAKIQAKKIEECRDLGDVLTSEHGRLLWERLTILENDNKEFLSRAHALAVGAHIVDREWLAKESTKGVVVYEGAQGALLDEHIGFHPHTTWGSTTPGAAFALEGMDLGSPVEVVGVLRAYMTRHGAGPLVTEDAEALPLLEGDHNSGGWAGPMRAGWFDVPAISDMLLALSPTTRPTSFAITWLDVFHRRTTALPVCLEYENAEQLAALRSEPKDFAARARETATLTQMRPTLTACESAADFTRLVEFHLGRPVKYVSLGPTFEDKARISGTA